MPATKLLECVPAADLDKLVHSERFCVLLVQNRRWFIQIGQHYVLLVLSAKPIAPFPGS